MSKTDPNLTGVPETMLWTIHNRALEARRPDGYLRDPETLRIYDALDYDFERSFGRAEGSHAVRAAEIDRVLRAWLERHPDGQVVSLGEGLETTAYRVDNGRVRWLSVDLPEAIRVREVFLAPTERFRHLAASATDPAWMDRVDPSRGVFVVAEGLFMYLRPDEVREIVAGVAARFPGAETMFDVVPRWFSKRTVAGVWRTKHYKLPAMPFGMDLPEIEPTLRSWTPAVESVEIVPYCFSRGLLGLLFRLLVAIPPIRRRWPTLVHVRFRGRLVE